MAGTDLRQRLLGDHHPAQRFRQCGFGEPPRGGPLARTCSMYWSNGTGAAPAYWLPSSISLVSARPDSVNPSTAPTLPIPSERFTWRWCFSFSDSTRPSITLKRRPMAAERVLPVEIAADSRGSSDQLFDCGLRKAGFSRMPALGGEFEFCDHGGSRLLFEIQFELNSNRFRAPQKSERQLLGYYPPGNPLTGKAGTSLQTKLTEGGGGARRSRGRPGGFEREGAAVAFGDLAAEPPARFRCRPAWW